jgi:hypothetical protein
MRQPRVPSAHGIKKVAVSLRKGRTVEMSRFGATRGPRSRPPVTKFLAPAGQTEEHPLAMYGRTSGGNIKPS